MTFSMDTVISYAIENCVLISFKYEGLLRIVEPYCYGRTSKGHSAVRVFQVDGDSSDGTLGWKLFDISKAENLQLTGRKFLQRTGYKKGDKAMTEIYKEV